MRPFYDSVHPSRLNTLMKARVFTRYTDDTLILTVGFILMGGRTNIIGASNA